MAPERDPAVFMIPKMLPECLGAISTAFGTVPNLWKALAKRAKVVSPRQTSYTLIQPESNKGVKIVEYGL